MFADHAPCYHEAGFNVIPLAKASKRPIISEWQNWCSVRVNDLVFDQWLDAYPESNIGLPLGAANNIIALDFDHDEDGLHQQIEKIAGYSPVRKTGAKGFTAFYQHTGEHNKKWQVNKRNVVELLSTGAQTVIPPSIHPDTDKPYIWLTEDSFPDFNPKDLPKLPKDFTEKVDKLLGYDKALSRAGSTSIDIPPFETIRDALPYIPSETYATWVTVGMALHHSYGDDAFALWDMWSKKAHNYDPKVMQYKWKSFGKHQNPCSAGTILHYAIGYGWLPQVEEFEIHTEKHTTSTPKNTPPTKPIEKMLDAPGLIGEIADWINSCAYKKQPALSLGAAIAAAGTIYAHRIATETDLRSNFMCLGVSGSSTGKENARKCIKTLFERAGLLPRIMGDFVSDASILTALSNSNGIGLTMPDEFGREIAAITKGKTASHEARIMTTLMKIFTSADTMYIGKQYANHDGSMERKDINQPCLSIYATTTPGRFFDALTGSDVIDGFLPRWLVFQGDDNPEELIGGGSDTPPQALLDIIAEALSVSEMDTASLGAIKPKIRTLTDGARNAFAEWKKTWNERRASYLASESGYDAVWGRTHEHASKLALVASMGQEIRSSDMMWACELANALCEQAVQMAQDRIADNETHGELLKLLAVFKKQAKELQWIPHRDIVQRSRWLTQRKRNEIIASLVESGEIQHKDEKNGNGVPVRKYRLTA